MVSFPKSDLFLFRMASQIAAAKAKVFAKTAPQSVRHFKISTLLRVRAANVILGFEKSSPVWPVDVEREIASLQLRSVAQVLPTRRRVSRS